MERRLSAILAADVVGYSRLMELNELRTFERFKQLREHHVIPAVAGCDGRVFKLTGDGFLAEFASAAQAVRCAIELQEGMVRREATTPEEERIVLRIGINLGDVIVEDGPVLASDAHARSALPFAPS